MEQALPAIIMQVILVVMFSLTMELFQEMAMSAVPIQF